MSGKRPFHDDDGNFEDTEGNSSFEVKITKILRQLVGEEIKPLREKLEFVGEQLECVVRALLHPTARPSFSQAETSQRRGLQLVFVNKLPSTIFTDCNIKANDHERVKIELVDTNTKTVVKTGPYSSIKIEIVVLDGDFCSDDNEDWSENEFQAKVIHEREGKRPLVTGDLNITLEEGVGALGDMVFTDNSSWVRCRKFRLGARVLQRRDDDLRIKEGRSEAFVVKDHRGKLNEKHYPPTLDDEIWRLEKIARDGRFHGRLTARGVNTVRDFLQWHTTDPTSLHTTLKCQTKTWDTIVEHATTCVVDDKEHYVYYGDTSEVGLLFNSIYQLVAATFDRKNYLSLDRLTSNQKSLVENQKKHAFKNVKDFVPVDAPTILGPSMPLTYLQAQPLSCSISILQNPEVPVSQPASTSFAIYEDSHQFQLSSSQNTPPIQGFNPAFKNSFTTAEIFSTPYNEETSWSAGGSHGQIASTSNLATDQMSTLSPVNGIWGQDYSFFFPAGNDSELGIAFSVSDFGVNIPSTGQGNAAARCKILCKVLSAIMCALFWRNLARRKAMTFCLNHY